MPTKLIPFPARRVQRFAARLLICSASRERLSPPLMWTDRPVPPEPLGNMLQRLALERPRVVLLLENIVADMLTTIDQ
jgi:hypothetical protein